MKSSIGLVVSAAASLTSAALCNGAIPTEFPHNGDTYSVTLSSGRQFLIQLPLSYDGKTAKPVYFSFHGGGQNARDQQALSCLSEADYNPNGIAIFPTGTEMTTGSGAYYWLSHPGISEKSPNDLDFTTDMIDWLDDHLCIDSSRIYASGKSNGGGLVNLLACDADIAPKFAAFASISGAYYEDKLARDCSPGRAVPILSFHGVNDTVIPYDGKAPEKNAATGKVEEYTGTYPIDTWLDDWATRNGFESKYSPDISTAYDGSVEVSKWTLDGDETLLVHYKESNLGHVWASLDPNMDCPTPIPVACPMGHYTFNATTVMMDWFGQWVNPSS